MPLPWKWEGESYVTYLVYASEEDAEWRVDQGELAVFLRRDWPDSEVQEPTPSDLGADGRGFRWVCRLDGGETEAWLNKEGTCLSIDGDLDGVAELAAWFRGILPQEVEFALCDNSYSFHSVIAYGASAGEISGSIPG